MASDLFVLDGSFFSDPLSPSTFSSFDFLQTFPCPENTNIHPFILQNPVEQTNYSNQADPSIFFGSPPSHQFESLSLSQFPDVSCLEVKTKENQFPIPSVFGCEFFGPHSYNGSENVGKFMQRSFSSNCFDEKPNYLFQPCFETLMESPNFQPQIFGSPENSLSGGKIRRVCSTGDIQDMETIQTNHGLSSSPLAIESSFIEDANSKLGRYTAEERKERIHRYRAKRTQRNFNKTIKYTCRKTLADNRPRIRGRFARNDEIGETHRTTEFFRYGDEYDLWNIDGINGEEEGTVGEGSLFNILGPYPV